MPILDLSVWNIGPFDKVKFRFDKRVNVFVGPNNCGKSTILAALGDITVYPFEFPQKLIRKRPANFTFSYHSDSHKRKRLSGRFPITRAGVERKYWTPRWNDWEKFLEEFEYSMFVPALRQSSDFRAEAPVAKQDDDPYRLTVSEHREVSTWRGEKIIGPVWTANENEEPYEGEKSQYLRAREMASFGKSAYVSSDKGVIQKMIELDYRAYRKKDPSIRGIIDKIASIASEVTEGFPISFVGVGEDITGLFPEFQTPDGIMPLNYLSQGTQSIVHSLAQLLIAFAEYYGYPKKLEEQPGILIIDEIDAHLHPSWQRRFLPALTRQFPNIQIFCSTHSPLVLGGLKAGQVQLLRREPDQTISVSTNEYDIVGWTVDEVLRNILDVATPTDLSTEKMLQKLQALQSRQRLTAKDKLELEKLRKSVNEELLAGPSEAQFKKLEALLTTGAKERGVQTGGRPRVRLKPKSRAKARQRSSKARAKK